jgi:hypothetical protein
MGKDAYPQVETIQTGIELLDIILNNAVYCRYNSTTSVRPNTHSLRRYHGG